MASVMPPPPSIPRPISTLSAMDMRPERRQREANCSHSDMFSDATVASERTDSTRFHTSTFLAHPRRRASHMARTCVM